MLRSEPTRWGGDGPPPHPLWLREDGPDGRRGRRRQCRGGRAFHLHVVIGMMLFGCWPFTRLVHAFSAPVGYLFRPYIVYRRGKAAPAGGTGTGRRDRKDREAAGPRKT